MTTMQELLIKDMRCASCVLQVKNALQALPNVSQVRVNLVEHTALVIGDADIADLMQAVKKAGYTAEKIENDIEHRKRQQEEIDVATVKRFLWQTIAALSVGIPTMLWGMLSNNAMITSSNCTFWLIIGLITLGVMVFAGGHFYTSAWKSLKNCIANMDLLISLSTSAAWIYSMSVNIWPQLFPMEAQYLYYEVSSMIIGLINLGHMFGARVRRYSSKTLRNLLNLIPSFARVITEGKEEILPLSKVQPGMILRLITGDRVPATGKIIQGEGWLDESMLTGESSPQKKHNGDIIHAGTVVQDGSILFLVNEIGSRTKLFQIIRIMKKAQSSKLEIVQLVDKISVIFVPIIICIAIFSGTIWYFIGPAPNIIYTLTVTTAVLIIACPCTLGLAMPISIISSVGRAAEFGILVRDADVLQKASSLDTLVFDKTGTLTEGKPQVVEIKTIRYSKIEVLRFAATLEYGSNHPLARAILEKARNIPIHPQLFNVHILHGQGVSGEFKGHKLILGSQMLLNEQNIDTNVFNDELKKRALIGETLVLLAIDNVVAALFVIRDSLRADSTNALKFLHQKGYRLIMLSGDSSSTSTAIAKEVGSIDEVIANVLPDRKAKIIRELQQQGNRVAMIGDGINDAPALAQADVGIAIGGGSDLAVEAAAITLVHKSLIGVADVLAISKATLRIINQNLIISFFYNLLSIPIATGIFWPFIGILLNPMFASIAMVLSSISVISNASRLIRFNPRKI